MADKWIVVEDGHKRLVDSSEQNPDYCVHGVPLFDPCQDCTEEYEDYGDEAT